MRRPFAGLDTARSEALGAERRSSHSAEVRYVILALVLAGCAAGPRPPAAMSHTRTTKTTGAIIGLARDHDSGDPIALAEIRLRGKNVDHVRTTSNDGGLYLLERLPPGKYVLLAEFAGQPLEVYDIDVKAGDTTHVDLVFTLGRPDPIREIYGDPKQSQIDRYRPPHLGEGASIIEGTVNDLQTHERVTGAVVTVVTHGPAGQQTEITVSDDDGRYKFENVAPGTYALSAYYSVSGRGQIEVRRSDIAVAGAEAVIVPLWIEMIR